MITIINYGSGNIKAITNIYDSLKVPYKIANEPNEVLGAQKLFLPGVGDFDATISKLDEIGFRQPLDYEVLVNKVPILGICVGMQILADSSEEGTLNGLGYIKGRVKKIDTTKLVQKPYLPHLGWNSIKIERNSELLDSIDQFFGFYFLHTYYFECANSDDIICTTDYGDRFASVVNNKNVFGVQFHPEKSHRNGVVLLNNFAKLNVKI